MCEPCSWAWHEGQWPLLCWGTRVCIMNTLREHRTWVCGGLTACELQQMRLVHTSSNGNVTACHWTAARLGHSSRAKQSSTAACMLPATHTAKTHAHVAATAPGSRCYYCEYVYTTARSCAAKPNSIIRQGHGRRQQGQARQHPSNMPAAVAWAPATHMKSEDLMSPACTGRAAPKSTSLKPSNSGSGMKG